MGLYGMKISMLDVHKQVQLRLWPSAATLRFSEAEEL